MSKKNNNSKKILKKYATKSKNTNTTNTKYEFEILDFVPTNMFMPNKYYTARMNFSPIVQYLDEGDIVIIDPTIKRVREGGIYVFEYKGHVMIRQFMIMPFGYKDIENKKVYFSIDSPYCDYYAHDEINVLGAVISKQVQLFHGLYYNNPMYRAYGAE